MTSGFMVARDPLAARCRRLAIGLRLHSNRTGTRQDVRRETVQTAYPLWSSVALQSKAGT